MKDLSTDNHVGYKVRLFPTRDQIKEFYKYFGMSRFVYNKCIDLQEEHYEKEGQYYLVDDNIFKRLSFNTLCKEITKLKHTENYKDLNKYDVASIRGAIKDCCTAYKKYDDNNLKNGKPKYKSRIYSKKQFYIRNDRLDIRDKTVYIPKIGEIKYCNSYGDMIIGIGDRNNKSKSHLQFYNPRISYDGNHFYLSFTITKDEEHQINSYTEYIGSEEWKEQESLDVIGIDMGLKNDKWLVDSTGRTVERPDSSVLKRRIRRMRVSYDRKKKIYDNKPELYKKHHPNGSKNMQKVLKRINKDEKKISNRRRNVVHNYACDLLKQKPKAIVMESISAKEIVNKHSNFNNKNKLHIMTYDASLYETSQIIEKKLLNNGIPVIRADSNYPSSQICSCCGYRQNIGQRKTYECPECGTIINRDINAAINLRNYAYENYTKYL